MIAYHNGIFGIHGDGFFCLLRINPFGLPELQHFGEPVTDSDADAFLPKQGLGWGSSVLLDDSNSESCPDAMALAWSGCGRGDYRESPLEVGCPTDFRYSDHQILECIAPMEGTLPQATGIVSLTLIFSGIKVDGGTADAIRDSGKLIVKVAMFAIPLLMIIAGYIVYLKKYKISEEFYAQILNDLDERESQPELN